MICKYVEARGTRILRSTNDEEATMLEVLAEMLPTGRFKLPTRTADVTFLGKSVDPIDRDAVTLEFDIHPKLVMW